MQGLGGTGAQQSKDCSFPAGSVAGAPLRISWFLVIFFISQLIDAVNAQGLPIWVKVVRATGNEFLLLLTVLCHEMGHGTMARRRGGDIAEVLLWPFGGICFTTRARGRQPRDKLYDDLLIVAAGPATHFPMTAAWYFMAAAMVAMCSHVVIMSPWRNLIPFYPTMQPCIHPDIHGCFNSFSGWLLYGFLVQGIQLNVMLFMFNVFFPMYPMDGAKLIVCSLQLYCGASAKFAAKVLVYTSVPLAVLFIGHSLFGLHGGGLQPGITAYMGLMCLSEAWKIYKLMKEERLFSHPLFEQARSSTREVTDGMGSTVRLNDRDRDDEETARPQVSVQFTELKPFSGSGRALNAPALDAGLLEGAHPPAGSSAGSRSEGGDASSANGQAASSADPAARTAWLDRMEKDNAHRAKSVRELEDERLAQKERSGAAV